MTYHRHESAVGPLACEELIKSDDIPAGLHAPHFFNQSHRNRCWLGNDGASQKMTMRAALMIKGAYLLEVLRIVKKRYPVIGDIDALGLAARIELTK